MIVARLNVQKSESVASLGKSLGFDLSILYPILWQLEEAGLVHPEYDLAKLAELSETITYRTP